MSVADDKRESGTSLIFMSVAVWVFDLLVVFFLPAGFRLGSQGTFFSIIGTIALLGVLLMVVGYSRRYYGGPEE
jgi:Na+-driven multidrug efflux pump